jgi:hypothetical protein
MAPAADRSISAQRTERSTPISVARANNRTRTATRRVISDRSSRRTTGLSAVVVRWTDLSRPGTTLMQSASARAERARLTARRRLGASVRGRARFGRIGQSDGRGLGRAPRISTFVAPPHARDQRGRENVSRVHCDALLENGAVR